MSATRDLIAAALTAAGSIRWQYPELADDMRELCARAMVEPDDWQPIETAPKDVDVLLFCPRFGVVRGRWSDEKYAKTPRPYWKNDRTNLFGIQETRKNQPTHWMPLPEVPK